ncbi:MAG: DMT family transporter [Pseudomonadota bacterium]
MELWIPITLCAAFMQNLRSALQKHLKSELSTSGATFSRFLFAAPLAVLYASVLLANVTVETPEISGKFLIYCAVGGTSQIIATALLVYLFSFRNFAVGTTYSKTEVIQTALFGVVLLGEPIGWVAVLAILVSLVGVMLISVAKSAITGRNLILGWTSREAMIGIASGGFFGVSAVSFRAASLSLDLGNAFVQAATTLAVALIMQTLGMMIYLRLREPGQIRAVVASWRVSSIVGLSGMLGSVGWFTAMTLQNAAYVRALGQVELVFTFLASYLFFKERSNALEIGGIGLIVAGIVVLLLFR